MNRVSGRVVAEVGFRSPITKNVSGEPSRSIDGLVKDDVSGTMYVYSDESLYEVSVLQVWYCSNSMVRGPECLLP